MQPMAHFQVIPWTSTTRMLVEVGPKRCHPVTGAPAGVEARAVHELPLQGTTPTPITTAH